MRVCVEACPFGTFLNTSSHQCVPCHDGCRKDMGCAGPLPYVNTTDGCLACDRVQLDGEGNQVRNNPVLGNGRKVTNGMVVKVVGEGGGEDCWFSKSS